MAAAPRLRRFARFACFDWSGAAVARPPGIALAIAAAGDAAPALVGPPGGWSREAALAWMLAQADAGADLLIGIDASLALPFADAGAYFPGWTETPADARALWALVDRRCAGDPHLAATSLIAHPDTARYFRRHGLGMGDRFGGGLGRLRATERACRAGGHGPAQSGFNLVGPAQVGKSTLTALRLLRRLDGRLAIWPFDPLPGRGTVLVELYTSLAARAAGRPPGRSKLRDRTALAASLGALGSAVPDLSATVDDHQADALLGAAWLRRAAANRDLWSPPALTPALARTEGWTFGIP